MDRKLDLRLDRILVVKLAGIGDLLTAFPALEAIRLRHPSAEITGLVTPATAPMLADRKLVDRVTVLDKYAFDDPRSALHPRGAARLMQLALTLKRGRFDAAILLHHLLTRTGVVKYAFLMLATGARLRVGLDDGRGWFLNRRAPDAGFGAVHEVDYWRSVAERIDASGGPAGVRISWGREEERYAEDSVRLLGAGGKQIVALHPGTGSYSPARRWDPECFSHLAQALSADGLAPVIVAGPGEEELGERVARLAGPGSRTLGPAPTPVHLAAFLSRCRMFVGNDSGVMHLASAAGVPVVAIFGPSNHMAWGPYDPSGQRSRIVRLDIACSPCMYRGQSLGLRYGCGNPVCLKGINPDTVVAAARRLLRETDAPEVPDRG